VGLVSKRSGRPLDELTAQAVSDGWLMPGSTSSDLLDALRSDIGAIKSGTGTRAAAPGATMERQMARQVKPRSGSGSCSEPARVEELPKYAGSITLNGWTWA